MKEKLKNVCKFYSGTGFPLKYQGNEAGELPFYKVGDIANNVSVGNIYLSLCNNYISRDILKEIKGNVLPANTVVFAKIGEAVRLNRRAITSCECLIDNNAMGLAPIQGKLKLKYFFYYMKKLKMESLAETTTVPSVKKSRLEEVEIEIPSLDIQENIAAKLDTVNQIILLRKKELKELDDLIKSQFIEMFGDPMINSKQWDVMKLKDIIVKANNGMARRGKVCEGNIVLRLVELQDGHIDYSNVNRIVLTEKEKEKYLLEDDDFLFARVNGNPEYVGRCAVFKKIGEPVYHNDHIIRVHFNEKILEGHFVSSLLNSDYGKKEMRGQIKTSAGQYTISQDGIGAINVIVPPIELQNEFAQFVQQVDKLKFEVQKALDDTQMMFDSLMNEYFG